MVSIILHISNEDPIVCEVDALPEPTSQFIIVHNPRKRDGKDIHYLDEDVTSMLVPFHRVNFVQLLPSGEVEEVFGFVRE
ncbi:MAG: hypothetical protein DWQ04_02255 [Chloroflexi bacterium]|nr:MAG: hypothetical protein DWQ04_02255 [Chloroflexota bacterium]